MESSADVAWGGERPACSTSHCEARGKARRVSVRKERGMWYYAVISIAALAVMLFTSWLIDKFFNWLYPL